MAEQTSNENERKLNMIKHHKNRIAHFGVKNVGLYGSYSRGEQTPETLKADFLQDETLKIAVVRRLGIIGEATGKNP